MVTMSEVTMSEVSLESQDEILDVEHLIMQIQSRPALWDKHSKPYGGDRVLKTRLWEEVCQKVIPNWDGLTNEKKKKKGADVQKKWKNLKDCFSRELASQKTSVSGQSGKKKRKYVYFDQLSFLIPVYTPRDTSSSVKPMEESADSEDIQLGENTQQTQDSRQSRQRRKLSAIADKDTTDIDGELMNMIRESKKEKNMPRNFDEDVSFSEMLVPMLRKFNDDQKLNAKMEILYAMDRARRYVSDSQPVYPGSNNGMQVAAPAYSRSTTMQTVPPPIYLSTSTMYPNTSATRFSTEPGIAHASNIVILNNKTIKKGPRDQENCNEFLERFGTDLQSPHSVVSQDSEDFYDVTYDDK